MKHRLIPRHCERYHGNEITRPYFEGWYFKHSIEEENFSLSVICGISRAKTKEDDHAFIQIITGPNHKTYYIRFPYSDFKYDNESFYIEIGDNHFSIDGIFVDIKSDELEIKAELSYKNHIFLNSSVWSPSIMGPFSYIPNMECNHGVLSMKNKVSGNVTMNGKIYDMNTAVGYIEKDWGEAFPDSWVWLQGNVSKSGREVSFMFSAAKIPLSVFKFKGLICALDFEGKQYRFATYNSSKIKSLTKIDNGVLINVEKGKYQLNIKAYSEGFERLIAPTRNGMERELFESVSGEIELEIFEDNNMIVDEHIIMCGIEVSEIE